MRYPNWDMLPRSRTDKIRIKDFVDYEIEVKATGIPSTPPEGMLLVSNIYVNPETGKLVVEYETE